MGWYISLLLLGSRRYALSPAGSALWTDVPFDSNCFWPWKPSRSDNPKDQSVLPGLKLVGVGLKDLVIQIGHWYFLSNMIKLYFLLSLVLMYTAQSQLGSDRCLHWINQIKSIKLLSVANIWSQSREKERKNTLNFVSIGEQFENLMNWGVVGLINLKPKHPTCIQHYLELFWA